MQPTSARVGATSESSSSRTRASMPALARTRAMTVMGSLIERPPTGIVAGGFYMRTRLNCQTAAGGRRNRPEGLRRINLRGTRFGRIAAIVLHGLQRSRAKDLDDEGGDA